MKPIKPFAAMFLFFGELTDFLHHYSQNERAEYRFDGNPSIKDAIEAQGVPHTEVDFIIVNNVSVGFDYHLNGGDRVEVYPVSVTIGVSPLVKLREGPPDDLRFICDVHLGKLARFMRLLGFDTLYRNDYNDPEIVQVSVAENRAVLTRDLKLFHAKVIVYGYWPRSKKSIDQLSEVVSRFDLEKRIVPFSRCLTCNAALKPVEKRAIEESLEPKTRQYYEQFHRCEYCQKIFWRGSHFGSLVNSTSVR